jgi:hypothetical protein
MSAFGGKAETIMGDRHVRFLPKADIPQPIFDMQTLHADRLA